MAPPGKFEVEVVMTWDPPGARMTNANNDDLKGINTDNSVMINVTWINNTHIFASRFA